MGIKNHSKSAEETEDKEKPVIESLVGNLSPAREEEEPHCKGQHAYNDHFFPREKDLIGEPASEWCADDSAQ